MVLVEQEVMEEPEEIVLDLKHQMVIVVALLLFTHKVQVKERTEDPAEPVVALEGVTGYVWSRSQPLVWAAVVEVAQDPAIRVIPDRTLR
jgi:hypothetical protein